MLERPVVVLQPELAQPEKCVCGAVLGRQAHDLAKSFRRPGVVVEGVVGGPLIPIAFNVIGLDPDRPGIQGDGIFPAFRLAGLGAGLDEAVELGCCAPQASSVRRPRGRRLRCLPLCGRRRRGRLRREDRRRGSAKPRRSATPVVRFSRTSSASQGAFTGRGLPAARLRSSLLCLRLGVQPVDDLPLTLRIVLALQTVVRGRQLDVRPRRRPERLSRALRA